MIESNSNIDDIIFSFLRDEISLEDKKTLEEWLSGDPSHKEYFMQCYKIWTTFELSDGNRNNAEFALEKLRYKLSGYDTITSLKHPEKKLIPGMRRLAAVMLLVMGIGAALFYMYYKTTGIQNPQNFLNEISVPLGSKSNINLPDGTQVTLNAGSKLTYSMNYNKELREVNLIGEGYFKVAKQKDKPFIVHASKATIKALGTEFNVKAYPDENVIETILVRGSVVINENSPSRESGSDGKKKDVILYPGQKALIFKAPVIKNVNVDLPLKNTIQVQKTDSTVQANEICLETSDLKVETSWKENRWIIQGENMASLAVLLSRRFNVHIHIQNMELIQYKFSGIIKNETLEQVFDIMSLTIPMSYSIDQGVVILELNHKLEQTYKEAY